MKLNLVTVPKFVTWLYPKRIWALSSSKHTVYLTFDDGPIPEVTPWVLDTLREHNAKATFFCIGENIKKHKEIFKEILAEGHTVGNHTYSHLNDWTSLTKDYTNNVEIAQELINSESKNYESQITKLFRPPFGRLTSRQARLLQEKGYKIVMWSLLSYDFDTISEKKCYINISKNIHPGSIVVFHDSLKAKKNLYYTLPKILDFISEKGWKCGTL